MKDDKVVNPEIILSIHQQAETDADDWEKLKSDLTRSHDQFIKELDEKNQKE